MLSTTADRYTVISADCHAGGNHAQYREYLDPQYLDAFDAWRGEYRNPFRDLQDDGRSRNWDDERRVGDLHADGIVAEVLFPNTVPPFFPTGVVIAPAPRPEDLELRLAGLRAHNRWLADFVAARPESRAGLAQILLNDVDVAVGMVRWAHEHGITGVLLPGVAPDTPWIEPLFSRVYDPLWRVCEELRMPVTHHGGGSSVPSYGDDPAANVMYMMETPFYSNRALWHVIMAGVFERFPELVFVMTEQGNGWVPEALGRMDHIHRYTSRGRMGELPVANNAMLTMKPSEYFRRNCYLGASFPTPREAATFEKVGVERIMWGSDYPHHEATYPYSRESLRLTFSGWDEVQLRQMLGENAAKVYGFDLEVLAPIAAEYGPSVEEIATPLDVIPADATSPAFVRRDRE